MQSWCCQCPLQGQKEATAESSWDMSLASTFRVGMLVQREKPPPVPPHPVCF